MQWITIFDAALRRFITGPTSVIKIESDGVAYALIVSRDPDAEATGEWRLCVWGGVETWPMSLADQLGNRNWHTVYTRGSHEAKDGRVR